MSEQNAAMQQAPETHSAPVLTLTPEAGDKQMLECGYGAAHGQQDRKNAPAVRSG